MMLPGASPPDVQRDAPGYQAHGGLAYAGMRGLGILCRRCRRSKIAMQGAGHSRFPRTAPAGAMIWSGRKGVTGQSP
jgi:hypothetical protein